jgi:hypothetical protein
MHLVDALREYLGWCPDRRMTPAGKRTLWQEMRSDPFPTEGSFVLDKLLIDYGSTGASRIFTIVFAAGVTGIVIILSLIRMANTLLAGILMCGLIFSAAIVIFYLNIQKATVEITRDSLVIHMALWRPVVIPKHTIATAEVRDNKPPFPLWLQTVLLLLVIPASAAGVIYGQYMQFASGETAVSSFFMHLGFDISIVLFFLVIYHHSRIRSYYPSVLVITTTTKKMIGIYGIHQDEIAGMLERSA